MVTITKKASPYIWLVIGSSLLLLMGWKWNVPIAVWLAPVFLIRFFRSQERWLPTLIALPVMTLPLFANIHGGWDFPLAAEIGIGVIRALPFLVALYVDRFLARRLRPGLATLTYPATYVMADYLLALSPLGTAFSAAVTQFDMLQFIQLTSVTGIWGLSFVIGWFASVVNLAWECHFDIQKRATPAAIFAMSLAAILLLGGFRLSVQPAAQTVRVAGVTIEHPHDYWTDVIDKGTPQDVAHRYEGELGELQENLYAKSRGAVGAGARIVFWSEANAVVYPEELEAFLGRAQRFATEHGIYFAPAYMVFRYGETFSDNVVTMITPSGDIAYTYEKTKSWYPTNSDGIIRVIDTPYGRLSSVICFDMDFPAFIHQAAAQDVDIMLVPAFDWKQIKPFHTQVGLFRAVEDGFSVIRQVNKGTSMAVDYQGRLLAYQDFFTTPDRLMLVDVPTQGVRTLYGMLGDWFVYASGVVLAGLILVGLLRRQ
ncbi:MAG: hypothetical protein GXP37_15095 [Chloroflexi bacterium]|nr:hypothetical protein [Chloroflexota bacterium]